MGETLKVMDEHYQEYLKDESKKRGKASWICFPKSIKEIELALKEIENKESALTIQGSRTGIAGEAVPHGGGVINLSRFNQIIEHDRDNHIVHAEAGVTLDQLKSWVFKEYIREAIAYFWPMDPTEYTATLGGIVKTEAFGVSSLHYGKTWEQIQKVLVIDKKTRNLSILEKDRIKEALKEEYIILEIWLILKPKPKEIWSIAFLFENNENAVSFLDQLDLGQVNKKDTIIALVEYMDQKAIFFGNEMRQVSNKINVPIIKDSIEALVFVEIHGVEEDVMEIAEKLLELSENHGVEEEDTWVFSGESEAERMREFRHAVAEGINLDIENRKRDYHKLIKMYIHHEDSQCQPSELIARFKEQLVGSGLEGAIYGCGIIPYLYCDLLPKDQKEMEKAAALIRKWA